MRKVNEIRAGAVLGYINLGLMFLVTIIYTPFMIKYLGDSEYGLYNLANSIIGYLGVFDFGMGNAVIRFASRSRALKNKQEEYGLYGLFLKINLVICVIVSTTGLTMALFSNNIFSNTLSSEELLKIKYLILIMTFNLAVSFPLGVFSSIITIYEKFIFSKSLAIIKTLLSPILTIVLLVIGFKSIGLAVLVTILNLSIIILNMIYCLRKVKVKFYFSKFENKFVKQIISYSFFVFLNIIFDKIYWNTDQFILGAVSGTESVAVYSIGSIIINAYINSSSIVTSLLLPMVTRIVAVKTKGREISDLFIKIGRIQLMILGAILIIFSVYGKDFICLWAGKSYYGAYNIVLVIILPLTIPLIQNTGILILQAENRNMFRSIVLLIIALLNIAISIPLGKLYGGFGCAAASSICFILGTGICMNIYYYKKIEIDIPRFYRSIFKAVGTILLVSGLGLLANIYIKQVKIYLIILGSFILLSIYAFVLYKFVINPEEKQLIDVVKNSLLKKIGGEKN